MAHTYHELKVKTVAELREVAKGIEHEAVQGYTQLNKDHLLIAICKALNIPTHEHHDAVGFDTAAAKAKISALKQARDEAVAAHDSTALKAVRRTIHHYNHMIRRSEK